VDKGGVDRADGDPAGVDDHSLGRLPPTAELDDAGGYAGGAKD
jgi:hypothetical protein